MHSRPPAANKNRRTRRTLTRHLIRGCMAARRQRLAGLMCDSWCWCELSRSSSSSNSNSGSSCETAAAAWCHMWRPHTHGNSYSYTGFPGCMNLQLPCQLFSLTHTHVRFLPAHHHHSPTYIHHPPPDTQTRPSNYPIRSLLFLVSPSHPVARYPALPTGSSDVVRRRPASR